MNIQLTGKHIDLGESLSDYLDEKLLECVNKYSENPVDAHIVFSKDRHEFICDITVHLSTGLRTKATGRADEIYASADNALERMEKQLRRYKRRLKNHHNSRNQPIEAFAEASYVLEALQDDESAEASEDLQPAIIAETEIKVQNMTVGEAVMQMELSEERFMVFRNNSHGGVNVVYRREDGNIGWIDPRRT